MKMPSWFPTPDGFCDDPNGYLRNQVGHVVLGVVLAFIVGTPLVLFGYLLWELLHLKMGGTIKDGAEDYFFVACGAVGGIAVVFSIPMLAVGYLKRLPKT